MFQPNEITQVGGSPAEQLARRCVTLIKTALKPEVWSQQCDFKLTILDRVFTNIDTAANFTNICTALELLTFFLTVMRKEQILVSIKPLQKGIGACITSANTKVIRLVHNLIAKLMELFPTEPPSTKYEELDTLYTCVSKMIFEGLANYEKNTTANPNVLYGTLMILKAACHKNDQYIDKLINPFMRVLQRMTKEHLNPSTPPEMNPASSELLILCLELIKTRVNIMGVEMRKTFIGTILCGLIEKTPDAKVMKAIIKMLEEWMKNRNSISPSIREKSILLVKMMQYVEKRFANDLELNAQYLELVNFVYRDEHLKASELTSKLEPAFLSGLRCQQPHIRAKFFEVFDGSMRRRLHDRLLYIICSQNWEAIGPYYWIKQCIELLIVTTVSSEYFFLN